MSDIRICNLLSSFRFGFFLNKFIERRCSKFESLASSFDIYEIELTACTLADKNRRTVTIQECIATVRFLFCPCVHTYIGNCNFFYDVDIATLKRESSLH